MARRHRRRLHIEPVRSEHPRQSPVARGMIIAGTGKGGPHGGKKRAKEREKAWTREEWGDHKRYAYGSRSHVVRGVVRSTDPTTWRHVQEGEHSRIPPCCIRFFAGQWWPRVKSGRAADEAFRDAYFEHIDQAERTVHRKIEYVPCPACLRARRFVSIHHCSSRCAGQPGSSA